jgi:zinc transporter, ZIP family
MVSSAVPSMPCRLSHGGDSLAGVLEAAWWGFVGGLALLVGALIGLSWNVPRRAIGLVMAFGGGVLVSALTFELTAEAVRSGGFDATAAGLAAGSLVFFAGDRWLDRMGGANRKRSAGPGPDAAALGIVLGAILDGIPESAAIGVSLLGGEGVSVAVVAAVFLSNVPESLSAATGLRATMSRGRILALWAAVAVVSAIAAALGYELLDGASGNWVAFIQSFAAGAILTMLADTMFPEAFEAENRSPFTGVVTTLGFALAALLSTL